MMVTKSSVKKVVNFICASDVKARELVRLLDGDPTKKGSPFILYIADLN